MSDYSDSQRARPPRFQPEILPPERRQRKGSGAGPQVFVTGRRLVFRSPGPLSAVLAILGLGAVAALGALLFLGLMLVWLPIFGALVAGFILARMLGGPRR